MVGDVSIDQVTARVPKLERLCAQQIVRQADGTSTDAALIDQWGRVHRLSPSTVLGRELDECDLAVLDRSVSRSHAEVRTVDDGWCVEDRNSTNGTFVEGKRIDGVTVLSDGDRLTVGEVGFVFCAADASRLEGLASASIARTAPASTQEPPTLLLLGQVGGGGGVVEFAGVYVQLGPSQYALVQRLAERWHDESEKDGAVRGYARTVDLLHEIPWDTAYPEDNHVKQLVRRVRRAFQRADAPDPIESRYGFGYRLQLPSRIQSDD